MEWHIYLSSLAKRHGQFQSLFNAASQVHRGEACWFWSTRRWRFCRNGDLILTQEEFVQVKRISTSLQVSRRVFSEREVDNCRADIRLLLSDEMLMTISPIIDKHSSYSKFFVKIFQFVAAIVHCRVTFAVSEGSNLSGEFWLTKVISILRIWRDYGDFWFTRSWHWSVKICLKQWFVSIVGTAARDS